MNAVVENLSEAGDAFEAAPAVVMIDNPTSIAAEALASLRAQIISHQSGPTISPLAICAPSRDTGSTFIAVNLAVAAAQVGIRTLLIDANLRDPGVQELIIPPHEVRGLQQYLSDDASQLDVIQESIIANLSILYAGGVAANAQELISAARFGELVDQCAAEYDMVVLDTPPANQSADSRHIASVAGNSLVVARKDHSLLQDVKTLVEELARNEARVIGTVLTQF